MGIRLSEFNTEKLQGTIRLFMDDINVEYVTNTLSPKLAFATPIISFVLAPGKDEAPIVFRDLTRGDVPEATGPGPGPGPGPGSSIARPMGPMGPGSAVPPPPPPPGGGSGRPIGPMGPSPGSVRTGGETGQPGMPTGFDPGLSTSHIDLDAAASGTVTITVDITWKSETFNTVVYPWLARETNALKGKMEVNSGTYTVHATTPIAVQGQKKGFPTGTVDRGSDSTRISLPGGASPDSRLSLFVDLLPFLNRDARIGEANRKLAWFDQRNLDAAEMWVPELVVPYYPASSWRATSPYAPGRNLGGTNYVGIAGIGVDAARLNPANKEHAKLMGMTGYDWTSKREDVTDGLSNTIYLMQAKPGAGRPWIAGGGSTLVGINDDKNRHPMDDFTYKHPGQAKPGSYALMGDGSVRYIPADIKREVFYGMVTRAGGETILPGEDAPLVPGGGPGMSEVKPMPKSESPMPSEKNNPTPSPGKKD
jgi:hypothetical protein